LKQSIKKATHFSHLVIFDYKVRNERLLNERPTELTNQLIFISTACQDLDCFDPILRRRENVRSSLIG
jgi:hypothetical protein